MKGAWAHGAQERIVGQRLQHKQNQRLIATAIFSIVPRKCTFVEQRRTCCPQDVPPVVGNRHRFRRRDYCGGCESGPLEKGAREYFWPDWPDETLNLFSGQHSLRCLRKGKRYCFVFFGHSRLAVKLNIWSEGLVKLAPPPSQAWVGSWRSVQGLVETRSRASSSPARPRRGVGAHLHRARDRRGAAAGRSDATHPVDPLPRDHDGSK